MKTTNRYSTLGSAESTFEPGSNKRVLHNLLVIKKKSAMDLLEWEKLQETIKESLNLYDMYQSLTAKDICYLHKLWLG